MLKGGREEGVLSLWRIGEEEEEEEAEKEEEEEAEEEQAVTTEGCRS